MQLLSAEGSGNRWLLIDRCLISNPFYLDTIYTETSIQLRTDKFNNLKQLSVASIYFLFGLGSMALPDFLLHIRLASCSMPRFTSSSSRAALDVWILLCVWAALVVLIWLANWSGVHTWWASLPQTSPFAWFLKKSLKILQNLKR